VGRGGTAAAHGKMAQEAHYPAPTDALLAYKRVSFLLPTMRLLNSMLRMTETFPLNRTH